MITYDCVVPNCMCVCVCNDSVGPQKSSLWPSGSPCKIRYQKQKKQELLRLGNNVPITEVVIE